MKRRTPKWELGGDWEVGRAKEEKPTSETCPVEAMVGGLKRVSAGNGSCSAVAHSPVVTGRLEGKLPCVDGVWGDEDEKSVSHIWYYTAWIEKNGLGEARPEVTENSAEVKIRIKGMRTNVRSPRNYQMGVG